MSTDPKYGNKHNLERRRWAPKVMRGEVSCWRCGTWLEPGKPWDLGHIDGTKEYAGPECIPCNRASAKRGRVTATRTLNAKPGTKRQRLIRYWTKEITAGRAHCGICGRGITYDDNWKLGLVKGDTTKYGGPVHSDCGKWTTPVTAEDLRDADNGDMPKRRTPQARNGHTRPSYHSDEDPHQWDHLRTDEYQVHPSGKGGFLPPRGEGYPEWSSRAW